MVMDIPDLSVPLEGFEDVTPVPQDDGFNPVVPIAYPHNCEWSKPCVQMSDVSCSSEPVRM